MPTYNAVGVTATLSVASLQASLSTIFDLKQGRDQREDASRINDVFAAGRNLPERPVGADGSERGVMQFLGHNGDMPFFISEAGEKLNDRHDATPIMSREDSTGSGSNVSAAKIVTDSPLTSLGDTPSGGTPFRSGRGSPVPTSPDDRRETLHGQTPDAKISKEAFAGFTKARGFLDQPAGPQALRLSIEICHKTFLPKKERSKATGQDLKLEVFINGRLAGVTLLNRRGSAVEIVDNKLQFCGTRIHRQMEKPWVYDPTVTDDNAESGRPAKRWDAVNADLEKEANSRGLNRWGDRSPSADFLIALSKVELPNRFKSTNSFGIIDVVITAGAGKKYGPEAGYILRPARMDDPEYSRPVPANPFDDDVTLLGMAAENASPLRQMCMPDATSSLEVPLIRQQSASALCASPTPKRTINLTTEIDLKKFDLKMQVQAYENARGKSGVCRTLKQRLSDIRKMNLQNQEKHVTALKEELSEDVCRAIEKDSSVEEELQPSPPKKARVEQRGGYVLDFLGTAALADGNGTMDPMKTWQGAPPPFLLPEGAEPQAMLTQERIDMALGAGAASSGPLLRRIASTSPVHTPKKKTRASSLANSPCSQPVKEQRHMVNKTPTPQRSMHYHNHHPIPIDPALTGSPPSTARSGRGANRTRDKWIPSEHTAKDALKAFKVPDLCIGSAVGYGDAGVQRQVGKARGGAFKEDTLVVGMRFVVI